MNREVIAMILVRVDFGQGTHRTVLDVPRNGLFNGTTLAFLPYVGKSFKFLVVWIARDLVVSFHKVEDDLPALQPALAP